MPDTHLAYWIIFAVIVVASLILDLGVHQKRESMSTRESALWATFWIGLAALFGASLWFFYGHQRSIEYFTAFLLEKSLSVDNLFVFIVIFTFFGIPVALQRRVLFWGILGAVALRALFIWAGVELLARFEFLFFVFGAFLVFSAFKLMFANDEGFDPEKNLAYRLLKRFIPISDELHDGHFLVRKDGKTLATRLLVVLVVIEATDVVFAVDSIPAVLAISNDPFIIYTSNIFAILGLRALYFLLSGVMLQFRYLNVGLAIVLAFIGAKMIGFKWFHIPPIISLGVVAVVIGASIAASLWAERRDRLEAQKGTGDEQRS